MREPCDGFIAFLKREQPAFWNSLQLAEMEGLVIIDPETDAVTSTNQLRLKFPELHEILVTLTITWAEGCFDPGDSSRMLISDRRGKKNNISLEDRVRALFDILREPRIQWPINGLNLLKKIEIDSHSIKVTINLVTEDSEEQEQFRKKAESAIKNLVDRRVVAIMIEHVKIASEDFPVVE